MKQIGIALLLLALTSLVSGCVPGGLEEAAWALALSDDTEYAASYTDVGFNSVSRGMSEAEVIRVLGPPIDAPYFPSSPTPKWDKGMRWTRSPRDSNYRVRVVLFRDGRVVEKFAEFYVD